MELLKQQELKWMTALGISSRAELTKLACERQRLNTLWFALTTEDRLKLFREANGTGQDPVAIPKVCSTVLFRHQQQCELTICV